MFIGRKDSEAHGRPPRAGGPECPGGASTRMRRRYTGALPVLRFHAMRASILALPLLATLMMTACKSEDPAPAAPEAKPAAAAPERVDENGDVSHSILQEIATAVGPLLEQAHRVLRNEVL